MCLLQFRLVGKTALKLLLVFVEYTESNSRVLYDAIQTVDSNQGMERYLGKLIAVVINIYYRMHVSLVFHITMLQWSHVLFFLILNWVADKALNSHMLNQTHTNKCNLILSHWNSIISCGFTLVDLSFWFKFLFWSKNLSLKHLEVTNFH